MGRFDRALAGFSIFPNMRKRWISFFSEKVSVKWLSESDRLDSESGMKSSRFSGKGARNKRPDPETECEIANGESHVVPENSEGRK